MNISKDEQKKRFLERIDTEEKNWKFSAGDLADREKWDKYHKLYEEIIEQTGTDHSPWYIVPADQKWFARYLVSEIVIKVLEECNSEYPELPKAQQDLLADCKRRLMEEKD